MPIPTGLHDSSVISGGVAVFFMLHSDRLFPCLLAINLKQAQKQFQQQEATCQVTQLAHQISGFASTFCSGKQQKLFSWWGLSRNPNCFYFKWIKHLHGRRIIIFWLLCSLSSVKKYKPLPEEKINNFILWMPDCHFAIARRESICSTCWISKNKTLENTEECKIASQLRTDAEHFKTMQEFQKTILGCGLVSCLVTFLFIREIHLPSMTRISLLFSKEAKGIQAFWSSPPIAPAGKSPNFILEPHFPNGSLVLRKDIFPAWNQSLKKWHPNQEILASIHIAKTASTSFDSQLQKKGIKKLDKYPVHNRGHATESQRKLGIYGFHFDFSLVSEMQSLGYNIKPLMFFGIRWGEWYLIFIYQNGRTGGQVWSTVSKIWMKTSMTSSPSW